MERDILNAWTRKIPIPIFQDLFRDPSGTILKYQTFYVEDGSYLRLKNLTIGYSLPKEIYSKININKVKNLYDG
jgi:hypothetical protein